MQRFLPLLILVLGFSLRLAGIHFGLPSENKALTTYHPDEAITFDAFSRWDLSKLYFPPHRTMIWGGFHLFPTAIALKLGEVTGYLQIKSREFLIANLGNADKLYIIGRFLQIVCSALSILLLFHIVLDLLGFSVAVFSAFFFAISAVSIIDGFFLRPDPMMLFFALFSWFFASKVWHKASLLNSLLSGVFLGLAGATKYNGLAFGIYPFLIHLFSPDLRNRRYLLVWGSAVVGGVLIGCPFLLLSFSDFKRQFRDTLGMLSGKIEPVPEGNRFIVFFSYFLPYAMGWPLALFSVLGTIYFAAKKILIRSFDPSALLLISTFIIYLASAYPQSQMVRYTMPVVPLVVIFAAYFLIDLMQSSHRAIKVSGWILTIFIVGYTSVYSFAYLNLYTQKNVRELASEWIDQNISKDATIAIARSYYWTPPILRQYHPPYRIVVGCDDQSTLEKGILNLENAVKEAQYLVITQTETAPFLSSVYGSRNSRAADTLRKVLSELTLIQEFNIEPSFMGISFPKSDHTPTVWFLPNPKIWIYSIKKEA